MEYFASLKGPVRGAPNPAYLPSEYKNITLVHPDTRNSSVFLNSINTNNSQRLLENVPKELLSDLTPVVRLFKVFYAGPNETKPFEIELPLNNFKDPAEISPGQYLNKRFPPGHLAAGLKTFSFDYLGTNPAEVDYYINCRLKLSFASKEALFHTYTEEVDGSKTGGYQGPVNISFLDLIKRPMWGHSSKSTIMQDERTAIQKDPDLSHLFTDPIRFRIRIEVEYKEPDAYFMNEACENYASKMGVQNLTEFKESLLDAIRGSKVSFFLNLLKHEFHFRSDIPSGPFDMTLTYNGAVESSLLSPTMNILTTSFDIEKPRQAIERQALEDAVESARTSMEKNVGGKASSQIEGMHWESVYPAGTALHQSIFAGIGAAGKIDRYVNDVNGGAGSDEERTKRLWEQAHSRDGRLPSTSADPAIRRAILASYKETSELWSEFDASFNRDNDLAVQNYFKAREALDVHRQNYNTSLAQSLSKAYVRILQSLMGGGMTGRRNIRFSTPFPPAEGRDYPNRIYQINIPQAEVGDWVTKRTKRAFSEIEVARLDEAAERGDRAAVARIKNTRRVRAAEANKSLANYMKRSLFDAVDVDPTDLLGSGRTGKVGVSKEETLNSRGVASRTSNIDTVHSKIQRILEETLDHDAEADGEIKAATVQLLMLQNSTFGVTTGTRAKKLQWFYLGDLIDTVVGIARQSQKSVKLDFWKAPGSSNSNVTVHNGNLKVVLGDVVFRSKVDAKEKQTSLANVPISLDLWHEFWYQRVLKNLVRKYSLRDFLRDIMIYLIPAIFTDKCTQTGEPVNRVKTSVEYFTVDPRPNSPRLMLSKLDNQAYGASPLDKAYYAEVIRPGDIPRRLSSHNSKVDDYSSADFNNNAKLGKQEVIFIYASSNNPTMLMNDKLKDILNGIFYLEIGNEGTPLLSVSFNKTDIPGFLEAKAEAGGILRDVTMLSEPYNCTFSLLGNTLIKPGRHIYISLPHFEDTTTWVGALRRSGQIKASDLSSRGASRVMGLGGYYLIDKVSNIVHAQGKNLRWQTEVHSRWTTFGIDDDSLKSRTITFVPYSPPNSQGVLT